MRPTDWVISCSVAPPPNEFETPGLNNIGLPVGYSRPLDWALGTICRLSVVSLTVTNSGVFRGGTVRCPPPFGPTMKIFYRGLYMKRCVFCRFPANFRKIWANLRLLLNVQKQKVFQLQGGFAPPDPSTRGSAPGPRWGLRPQTPVISSRSAREPWPPLCQILNTPLITNVLWLNSTSWEVGDTVE